jgi:hypothetical protein
VTDVTYFFSLVRTVGRNVPYFVTFVASSCLDTIRSTIVLGHVVALWELAG